MLTAEPETAAAPARVAPAKPLRIGLLGGFGIGNFGNDASFEAVLGFLRAERPDAEITCICSKPDVVAEKFGVPVLPTVVRPSGKWALLDKLCLRLPGLVQSWAHALAVAPRFDRILVPGTGIFDDFRDTPMGWPSRLVRWGLAARLRGVRMGYLSVGAGPILNPISRFLMKRAALMADYRSYRDQNSWDYMTGIGIDESASKVLPDVAFLLPVPAHVERAAADPVVVGVGLMNYSGWRKEPHVYRDYVDTQVRFIEWLEQQGYRVRALVGQDVDWTTVREIEGRLGRKLTDADESSMNSFHDVMREIADVDLVVASRYHVQIAALKLGRPVLSLSYGPKSDDLLASAGLADFTQDIHQVDFARLQRQFIQLAEGRLRYGALVRERVAAMHQRLRAALAEMDLLGA